jgi:hypothetical protein
MESNKLIYLYKDFLRNSHEYEKCEKYWKKLAKELLGTEFNNYKEWFKNAFVNGKKCLDGNPIFTLIHKDGHKALRIVQEEPISQKAFLYGWVEKFDDNGNNIDVLALTTELSNQTEVLIQKIIYEWFVKSTKSKFMDHLNNINLEYGKRIVNERKNVKDTNLLLNVVDEINDITEQHISKSALLRGYAKINYFKQIYNKRNQIISIYQSEGHRSKNFQRNQQIYVSHHSEQDLASTIYTFIMFVSLDNRADLEKINSNTYFDRVSKLWGSRSSFTKTYYSLVERINELSEIVEEELEK